MNEQNTWYTKSWNPITGCKKDCNFCGKCNAIIAKQGFKLTTGDRKFSKDGYNGSRLVTLYGVQYALSKGGKKTDEIVEFPFGFELTQHMYRLDEPASWESGQIVCVGEWGDMFSTDVPDEWIRNLIEAEKTYDTHSYINFTCTPSRLLKLYHNSKFEGMKGNVGFGIEVHDNKDSMQLEYLNEMPRTKRMARVVRVKCDALLSAKTMSKLNYTADWVILEPGELTRNGQYNIVNWWLKGIVDACADSRIYMDEWFKDIAGSKFRQEIWEAEKPNETKQR